MSFEMKGESLVNLWSEESLENISGKACLWVDDNKNWIDSVNVGDPRTANEMPCFSLQRSANVRHNFKRSWVTLTSLKKLLNLSQSL